MLIGIPLVLGVGDLSVLLAVAVGGIVFRVCQGRVYWQYECAGCREVPGEDD